MSNALGIAAVTHVLKDLLNDGLINNNVTAATGKPVVVSSLAPILIEKPSGETTTQLNLFMYRATPNSGWNNMGYPSRNARGELINNPPLALDLHYLLTAYGDRELHSEILLGYGMHLFHEHPGLERAEIRKSLNSVAIDGNTLPLKLLSTSELGNQIELIKISPEPLNTEEMSKLWTAFQAKYRPCASYLVSVVLIESSSSTRSALRVKERKIDTTPFIDETPFRQPVIEEIQSRKDKDAPIVEHQRILPGYQLIIKGKRLKGEKVIVRISNKDFPPADQDEDVTDTQIVLLLPDELKAGAHGVQIVHQLKTNDPQKDRDGVSSNLAAFVLCPKFTIDSVENLTGSGDKPRSADIKISFDPKLHQQQKVSLLLNELLPDNSVDTPHSYSFLLKADILSEIEDPIDKVTFPISGVKAGNYLVRVQVDGAESPLEMDANGKYSEPQITIA